MVSKLITVAISVLLGYTYKIVSNLCFPFISGLSNSLKQMEVRQETWYGFYYRVSYLCDILFADRVQRFRIRELSCV